MIDDSLNVSDEMLAAYLDGNSTPLENVIMRDVLSCESIQEVADLVADCLNTDLIDNVEVLPLAEVVDDFTKPLREYEDLKNNLDMPDEKIIM